MSLFLSRKEPSPGRTHFWREASAQLIAAAEAAYEQAPPEQLGGTTLFARNMNRVAGAPRGVSPLAIQVQRNNRRVI